MIERQLLVDYFTHNAVADNLSADDWWESLFNEVKIHLQLGERIRIAESDVVHVFLHVEIQRQTDDEAVSVVRRTMVEHLSRRQTVPWCAESAIMWL